jgi:hypothetical protein
VLGEPLSAFPSWFIRVECDPCGKAMMNEVHAGPWRDNPALTENGDPTVLPARI